MSSKFNNRPAPRKRPWICQKGPPGLKMPPYPPVVLATISLRADARAPSPQLYIATFFLKALSSIGPYRGANPENSLTIELVWNWGQGENFANAHGAWMGTPGASLAVWSTEPVTQNPYLNYESHSVETENDFRWTTTLKITA